MSDYLRNTTKPRNPVTRKAHGQAVFWQIMLPLAIGVIALLVIAVLAAMQGESGASRWADISTIFLVSISMVFSCVTLLVFAGIIYLLSKMSKSLPGFGLRMQDFFFHFESWARSISDAAAEPVMKTNTVLAGWRALKRRIFGRRRV